MTARIVKGNKEEVRERETVREEGIALVEKTEGREKGGEDIKKTMIDRDGQTDRRGIKKRESEGKGEKRL